MPVRGSVYLATRPDKSEYFLAGFKRGGASILPSMSVCMCHNIMEAFADGCKYKINGTNGLGFQRRGSISQQKLAFFRGFSYFTISRSTGAMH